MKKKFLHDKLSFKVLIAAPHLSSASNDSPNCKLLNNQTVSV